MVVTIINGCNPYTIPLKGKYPMNPLEITSSKSIDSTWLDLTDLFALKGLHIKKIDKKEGLIVTKKTSFVSAYTMEDKDGNLEEPDAWVVLPMMMVHDKQWNPKIIYSQWSVQVIKGENGEALVKVDPVVLCTFFPNMFTKVETRGQSTGKMEELVKSSINR